MSEDVDKSKKDDIYWKVLNSALELEVRKGHLKWTITELSRKSKITRSLIYYYFGRSKIGILEEAIKLIGEEFIGLSKKRDELWQQGEFEQGLIEVRQFYARMPFLCAFYLTHRDKPNEMGVALKKIDQGFKNRIKKLVPKATSVQVNTLFAVYFGIAYSPGVGPEEIKLFTKFIKDIFQKLR